MCSNGANYLLAISANTNLRIEWTNIYTFSAMTNIEIESKFLYK